MDLTSTQEAFLEEVALGRIWTLVEHGLSLAPDCKQLRGFLSRQGRGMCTQGGPGVSRHHPALPRSPGPCQKAAVGLARKAEPQ